MIFFSGKKEIDVYVVVIDSLVHNLWNMSYGKLMANECINIYKAMAGVVVGGSFLRRLYVMIIWWKHWANIEINFKWVHWMGQLCITKYLVLLR